MKVQIHPRSHQSRFQRELAEENAIIAKLDRLLKVSTSPVLRERYAKRLKAAITRRLALILSR